MHGGEVLEPWIFWSKLRIPSEFPIGTATPQRAIASLHANKQPNIYENIYEKTNPKEMFLCWSIYPEFCVYVPNILPQSKCLYLAFTFSRGLPSAQFELKESPALIKISLKSSQREKRRRRP